MYPRVSFGLWEKQNAQRAVEAAIEAEAMGIDALWIDVSRNVPDPVTYYAAAAWATKSLSLGLSIVPTYPRHPAILANQAQALYQLGGARMRIGIGPSHQHIISGAYGLPFERPIDHLREYLHVLRALTETGECQFKGDFFQIDLTLDSVAPLPIYISALRARALRTAGELADGALTWLAPINYLRDEALRCLEEGAFVSGRPRPRLVASFPCVVGENIETVRARVLPLLAVYRTLPFYASMLRAATVNLDHDGWEDDAFDQIVFWGSPEQIREQVDESLIQGIDEITLKMISDDPVADLSRIIPVFRAAGLFSPIES